MDTITWADFMKVGLHFGTIIEAEVFAEARKPAYKLKIDFGPDIGVRKSSSQITKRYKPEELIGRQVLCVDDAAGKTLLVFADGPVENGARLL